MLADRVAPAVDKAHAGRARSQEHRGLARGIAPANDYDLLSLGGAGLELGCRVVKTCALEAFFLGHSELAVARSGGDYHGPPEECVPSSSVTS